MNWLEFKQWMEGQGVKDQDDILFIDTYPNEVKKAVQGAAGWEVT